MTNEKHPGLYISGREPIPVHGIFCDLDGVLINTEPYKFLAYLQVLIERGISMGTLFERNFFQYYKENCVGKSREDNCENQLRWCEENGFNLGLDSETYPNLRENYYKPIEEKGAIPLINGMWILLEV